MSKDIYFMMKLILMMDSWNATAGLTERHTRPASLNVSKSVQTSACRRGPFASSPNGQICENFVDFWFIFEDITAE